MLTRRQLLIRTLQASSLFAVGRAVPGFLLNTAHAAESGKDTVLVVLEMTGGNDGLNTVIPYADDLYHKARNALRLTKEQVVRVDDHIGLNPGMKSFEQLLQKGQLAVVQGVGYPNPDRSHFESMDIWQSAEVGRKLSNTGWLARSWADLQDKKGNVPVMQVGPEKLPLALRGAPGGVVSVNNQFPVRLNLEPGTPAQQKARKRLIEDLAREDGPGDKESMLQFVQRRQLQTYSTLDRLEEVLKNTAATGRFPATTLGQKLELVLRLIVMGFGTRVFYLAIDGFDTHSGQKDPHQRLLQEVADAITFFFTNLQSSGHDKRVLVMTFSEFGRRVQENGSGGTDHGSGSCLFVAGPGVKGGPVGKHPSLKDLLEGDLKYHTDFRRVYATLLDDWLGVDSRTVLGEKFAHVELLSGRS
jgi:uncharacterized protein (DUF1501 family)